MNKQELEEGLEFTPRFDENGLIPCITTSASDGDVLMFAFMNREALEQTIMTGEVHYWSRSRQCLWHKGATSGYTQRVIEMRTDCDQDCIWVKVDVNVPDGSDSTTDTACHTGRKTCFYREIQPGPNKTIKDLMQFKDADKLFNPDDVYKK
ncbi:MAG: phosphoribosyl-AMP cyclohydrolase [Alphaproteobacteria bacterium]